MKKQLTIALSKGRILKDTLPLLKKAGIEPLEDLFDSRKLIFPTTQPGVQLIVIRATDVPTYVEYGAADIGVSGKDVLMEHEMIINCSPLGTFPEVKAKPDIPYEFLTDKHLLFDLIYNPKRTAFLKMGENAGAIVSNGEAMLKYQADRSWEIWNS